MKKIKTFMNHPLSLPFNVMFLYFNTLVMTVIGFVFWIIVTRLGNSEILGTVSAMSSTASIIIAIASMGISTGVMRFLGKSYASGDFEQFGHYLYTATITTAVVGFLVTVLLLVFREQLQTIIKLPDIYVYLALAIGILSLFSAVLRSAFICARRTQLVTISIVTAGAIRLIMGTWLVIAGWGALGASIGYVSLMSVYLLLLTVFCITSPYCHTRNKVMRAFDLRTAGSVLRAGAASWLPSLVLVLGSQTGIGRVRYTGCY